MKPFFGIMTILLAIVMFASSCGNEEAGTLYNLQDTVDVERNGVRLIISYDDQTGKFNGTMENVTNKNISKARVEVHLSNGTELGPTTPIDLAPGETATITLDATGESFTTWSVHSEVG